MGASSRAKFDMAYRAYRAGMTPLRDAIGASRFLGAPIEIALRDEDGAVHRFQLVDVRYEPPNFAQWCEMVKQREEAKRGDFEW